MKKKIQDASNTSEITMLIVNKFCLGKRKEYYRKEDKKEKTNFTSKLKFPKNNYFDVNKTKTQTKLVHN